TSGTTGPPKGAMLQQRQILSSTHQQILDVQHYQNDRMLCFLPMAHVIERVLLFYARTDAGMPAAYATTMGGVLQELQEVRPTKFSSVPRLFEKAYATIRAGIAAKPAPVRALAAWAEGVGNRRAEAQLAGRAPSLAVRLQWPLAERLVFRKVQQAFGGQITMLLTGAAPIPPDVLRFFWAAGLPLYEGYGLTESTGLSHINRPGTAQLGSVGRPMTGLEHRLAEDGEVLLRGATIFAGYFRNDDATAEVLQDGWLHTGDIGTIDDTGFLRITDRKKHLIITAGGKNVAPANIARAIAAQSPWIGQVHPHGDRRPYISALITPSATVVLDHAMAQCWIDAAEAEAMLATLGRDPASRPEPLQALVARASEDAEVRTAILEAVQAGNRQLSRVERVRRFAILPRDFSREDEALTPTLKLRRKAIETRFSDEIERIYTDPAFGLEAEAAG
ncbi:MAG: AMP-binding protein, partial [Acidobacteriota bacterium]